jgi:hypothetical protein
MVADTAARTMYRERGVASDAGLSFVDRFPRE